MPRRLMPSLSSVNESIHGFFSGGIPVSNKVVLGSTVGLQCVQSSFLPLTPDTTAILKVTQTLCSALIMLGLTASHCWHERLTSALLFALSVTELVLLFYTFSMQIGCLPITTAMATNDLPPEVAENVAFGGVYLQHSTYYARVDDQFHDVCSALAWLDLLYPVILTVIAGIGCIHRPQVAPNNNEQPAADEEAEPNDADEIDAEEMDAIPPI